jgi:hypothetical protein
MQYKQLELFSTDTDNCTTMSFGWWLEELTTLFEAKLGFPLDKLLLEEDEDAGPYVYLERDSYSIIRSLQEEYDKGESIRGILRDLLWDIVLFEYGSEEDCQSVGWLDDRDEGSLTYTKRKGFCLRGIVHQAKVILDVDQNTYHNCIDRGQVIDEVIDLMMKAPAQPKNYCTLNLI